MSEPYSLYHNGPVVTYEMTNPITTSERLRERIELNIRQINTSKYNRYRIQKRMIERNQKKSDLSSRLLSQIANEIGVAEHLISDYEDWLENRLPQQIAFRSMVRKEDGYTFKLSYSNMRIQRPMTENGDHLYPAVARVMNLSYTVAISVDVALVMSLGEWEFEVAKVENVFMANIPIMIGSVFDRVELAVRDKIQQAKEEKTKIELGTKITPYSYSDRYEYPELTQEVISSMGESPLDTPGYFIVDGKSKIVKMRDGIRNNIFFIDIDQDTIDGLVSAINCTTPLGTSPLKVYSKHKGLIVVYMQMSGSHRYTNIFNLARTLLFDTSQEVEVINPNTGEIEIKSVPVTALDVDRFFIEKIYSYCDGDYELISHAKHILELTREYVKNYDILGSMVEMMNDFALDIKPEHPDFLESVMQQINNSVYPQISYLSDPNLSRNYTRFETFVYQVYMYIAASAGKIEPINRDDWGYKRIDTTGRMMELLYGKTLNPRYREALYEFESLVKDYGLWFDVEGRFLPQVVPSIQAKIQHIMMSLRMKFGTMVSSISTSAWGVGSKDMDMTTGTDDTSIVYRISQINTISPKVSKYDVNMPMRIGHQSGEYIYDVYALRENNKIGQEKEKSLVSAVSIKIDDTEILDNISKMCSYNSSTVSGTNIGICLFNGINIGMCNLDAVLSEAWKYKRFWRTRHITVAIEKGKITISTDAGRCLFPALVVRDGEILIKEEDLTKNLRELIEAGLIEYLDPAERYIISESWEYINEHHTHCVIHPAQGRSFSVLKQPYSERSDPVRVAYGGHMMRSIDESAQVGKSIQRAPRISQQIYGDHSLISSSIIDFMNRKTQDSTVLMVQVDNRNAANAEDALSINEATVQRNAFAIEVVDTITFPVRLKSSTGIYHLGIPSRVDRSRSTRHLNSSGFPMIGAVINKGDILVGRYEIRNNSIVDKSIISTQRKQRGIVKSVSVNIIPTNKMEVTIQFLKMHSTEQGRKFSHSFGQKGVAGKVEKPWDLSYIEETGRVADIFWNPMSHRRSTSSLLIEQFTASNSYATRMINPDGTPFTKLDLAEEMHRLNILTGIKRDGRDYAIDQQTGIRQKEPVYYSFPAIRSASKHDPGIKYQAGSGITAISTLLRVSSGNQEGNMKDGRMKRNIAAYHSKEMLNSVHFDGPIFNLYFCQKCGVGSHTEETRCFTCGEDSVVSSIATGPLLFLEALLVSKGYMSVYETQ